MLLNFSFENYKSFKETQQFSMVAPENPPEAAADYLTYDDDRLIAAGDPESRVLPITAIFGGNAFGKSNFAKALFFLQFMVTKGPQKGTLIPVDTFFLDPSMESMPASFDLNIYSEENEYRIFLKMGKTKIHEEKVSMIKRNSEITMYHRKGENYVNKQFDPHGDVDFALRASEENCLALSNSGLGKIEHFKPICNWFNETLVVVSPESRYIFSNDSANFVKRIETALALLDTGIKSIKTRPVNIRNLPLSKEQVDSLLGNIKSSGITYFKTPANDILLFEIENNNITPKLITLVKEGDQLGSFHTPASAESDGIMRLMDILPAILQLTMPGQGKVAVIDEFDKSLHTNMTRALINYHLNSLRKKSRSQLIFTTHDVDLIDMNLLRNDEIWIIDKSRDGASEMICLHEFEGAKRNLNFKELYKSHHLGGTPRIQLSSHDYLEALMMD